jgi:glycyl-tRNA synthetase
MQDALLRLAEYWASRGCLVVQPMNTKVGAGTLNPATFLRVLGPEPWRVAYVEPSVRPDDSRYGDNPNRLQTHTQYQVVLKPEPGDAQDLYLASLEALGVDLGRHDVRFVEDNWASPALGAWGLGWEVWLDGMEITQFTYFQQAGGFSLDPVSVEITYGIERIIMALQGVSHFADIAYGPGVSYGEAFGQAEYEMSRYYLDDADIAANRRLFDEYEAEAQRMIAARLPVAAHDYVLMCSHTFNVLDARGAIGTTERARAFARTRRLAHDVADLWIQRRQELGHPLGLATTTAAAAADPRPATYPEITSPTPAVLEIGVEEMPPDEVARTATAVRAALVAALDATRLHYGTVEVVSSPRRVVALLDTVAPREADSERVVRGPRASVAFGADGQPTRAALGFAKSNGVPVTALSRIDVGGVEYVGVVHTLPGRPAAEVLAGAFSAVVAGLRSEKNMRWNAPGLTFTRPVRWILALLGGDVVPFTVGGLTSSRATRVHRMAAEPVVEATSAGGYLDTLEAHGIVADAARRRAMVAEAAVALAADVGGVIDPAREQAVLDEITNLVERPAALLGGFEERYLELPADVLTTVMRKHQRYLPVRCCDGGLLPYFVAVANGACDSDTVRTGNEAVLRARFEDAAFFWTHDLRTPLEQMARGLSTLTFTERLGSMADRAARIAAIATDLADRVTLTDQERATLLAAVPLAKFDLASQMVIELSSLAGVMAREYALRSGQPAEVGTALFEMELPRWSGDGPPTSLPGALLALADRFDLLAGLFAVGAAPTGSSDPFALRRAAAGLIAILRAQPRLAAITVDDGLIVAGRHQPVQFDEHAQAEAAQFTARRFEQHLLDSGYPSDTVRAVLPLAAGPARAAHRAAEITELRDTPEFRRLVASIQRVRRIVPAGTPATYEPGLFTAPAEVGLYEALAKAGLGVQPDGDLHQFLDTATSLVEPIEVFFDDVLVMAEDPAVRANRLGLLAAVLGLAAGLLAWEELTGL